MTFFSSRLISLKKRKVSGRGSSTYDLLSVLAARGRFEIERLVSGREHVGHPGGRFDAVGLHLVDDLFDAEHVPGLERPEVPVVAPAQGVVDVDDGVRDLAETVRGVGQSVPHQPPRELAGAVVGEGHVLQALLDVVGLLGLLERRDVGPDLGTVVAGLPVDDQLGLRTVVFFLHAIEAALGLGLATERTGFDHLGDELRHLEDIALRIIGAAVVDRLDDVREDVDPHQVGGAEGCRSRVAHGRTGDRVHLVHLVVHLHHCVDGRGHAEGADAVADEVGRVLTEDNPLAEAETTEVSEEVEDLGLGLLTGHQLEEPHVANGVEEVGDQEVLLKVLRPALGHARYRKPRGVGGDDAPRFADFVDPREDLLLDVEALDHDLDDPVALRQPLPIVLEVADFDQRQEPFGVERGRLRLLDAFEPRRGELVPEPRVIGGEALLLVLLGELGRHDVEQHNRYAGVGEVGGNSGAHDAGSEDRGPLNISAHGSASRRFGWVRCNMVNEHSFILNHSPQDGKIFRRAAEKPTSEPAKCLAGLDS
jgi:hypothetical protein